MRGVRFCKWSEKVERLLLKLGWVILLGGKTRKLCEV
jgi:hypothetical protein